MALVRWVYALLASGVLHVAAVPKEGLLEALQRVHTEDEGRTLIEPHMDSLKQLSPQVVEAIVLRQWWQLARDMIAKSHEQHADLSAAVRKAVRTLKDEADELLRTLNPKYGLAQQVAPAFQWAQNDTSIYLTIKYTVRWNAPGALQATDIIVAMLGNTFNFTGLGKHSNNKYNYTLSLGLFDNIDPERSTWSAASVGKMSVTLRKKWTRKWPRLLDDKKKKIGNMHIWSERQDTFDDSLKGMTTASNSPITCAQATKIYCSPTDTCKEVSKCATCPGKTLPDHTENMCAGKPNERASLTFSDTDMQEGRIGGDVKITKARNEFDIDSYALFFGRDSTTKLTDESGEPAMALGEVTPTGSDAVFKIPPNTIIPPSATQLLVFSRNAHGEYDSPGASFLTDAVQPKARPVSVSMEDDSGDKGYLNGEIVIGKPGTEEHVDNYVLHWGKSPTRRIGSSSHISDVSKNGDNNPTHKLTSKKIPDGATHILAYTKNNHGEHPTPAAWKIVDNHKPCLNPFGPDCPTKVEVSPDVDPDAGTVSFTIEVGPAKDQSDLTHYALYWGRKECGPQGGQSGEKNGQLDEIAVVKPVGGTSLNLVNAKKPQGSTHILAFAKNSYGESVYCVSTSFADVGEEATEKKEL